MRIYDLRRPLVMMNEDEIIERLEKLDLALITATQLTDELTKLTGMKFRPPWLQHIADGRVYLREIRSVITNQRDSNKLIYEQYEKLLARVRELETEKF